MKQYTREALLNRARFDGEMADSMIRSPSGADQADSEFYRLRRLFWIALWEGFDRVVARDTFIARWRVYAAGQQAKVDAAHKTKRGPYQGQSAIHYRWVPPEKAEQDVDVIQAELGDGRRRPVPRSP